MKSKTARRNQAVANLAQNFFWELNHGQHLTVSCSATIVASSTTTIESRWSAKLLLDVYRSSSGTLDEICLADSFLYEESTIYLSWKTAEDCAALSGGYHFEWTDHVQKSLPWDNPANTDKEIATALRAQDKLGIGEQLLDRWDTAEKVDYTRYPRCLRSYFKACIEAERKGRRAFRTG